MSDKPTPTKSESFETIQPDKLEDEMMEPAIVNALAHLIRTIQSVETDNPERVRIAAWCAQMLIQEITDDDWSKGGA